MFLDKNSEEEFFNEVNEKLSKEYSNKKNYYEEKMASTINFLISGAYHLNQAGLEKEANVVIMMAKDLCNDPAVKMSPKDMVKNLEHEGWVFPKAKDLGLTDDLDDVIEVSEEDNLHDF